MSKETEGSSGRDNNKPVSELASFQRPKIVSRRVFLRGLLGTTGLGLTGTGLVLISDDPQNKVEAESEKKYPLPKDADSAYKTLKEYDRRILILQSQRSFEGAQQLLEDPVYQEAVKTRKQIEAIYKLREIDNTNPSFGKFLAGLVLSGLGLILFGVSLDDKK